MVALVDAGEITVEADEVTCRALALDVVLPIRHPVNGSRRRAATAPRLS